MSRSAVITPFEQALDFLEEVIIKMYTSSSDNTIKINELIKNEHKKLSNLIEAFESKHIDYSGFDHYFDELETVLKIDNRLLITTFIYATSEFEYILKTICDTCQIATKQVDKVDDLAGDGIKKYRKYLELIFNVKFENMNPQWESISNCYFVRNKLIHQLGYISETEMQNFINKTKNLKIKIDSYNQVSIDEKFIERYTDKTKDLLFNIVNQLRKLEK